MVPSNPVASLPAQTSGVPFLPAPSRTAASVQPQDSVASNRDASPQHTASLRSISPGASIHPPLSCGTADEQPQSPGNSNSAAPSHATEFVHSRGPVTSILVDGEASPVPSRRTTLTSDSLKSIVTAVDFLENGEVRKHDGYIDAEDAARVDCPLQPKTIRVLFCLTPNVFVHGGGRRRSESHGRPESLYTVCEACNRPTAGGDSIRSAAGRPLEPAYPAPAPLVSSQAETEDSHVSPHTRPGGNPSASVDGASHTTGSRSYSNATYRSTYNRRWKHYQAACGVTCNDLLNFWNRDLYPDAGSLILGANMALDPFVSEHAERIWSNAAFNERHQVMFNGDPLTFFTLPNCFLLSWKDDSLEVRCSMFGFETAGPRFEGSPLVWPFFRKLTDRESAPRHFSGDLDIGVRLVTLELLDALLSEWATFLETLRRGSDWLHTYGSFDIDLTSQDQQHISDFARATRDVAAASEATLKAIQMASHFTPEQQRAFDRRAFEKRLVQQDVRNMMKDLEDNFKNMMARAERSVNQRQENSLKRLTVVASIFLPLTLACSLLSMTNRVKELNALWWDWLGICFIIGFAIITGYRLSVWWNELMRHIRQRWAQQPFRDMWQRARNRIIKQERDHGNKVKRLLPGVTRWTLWTSKYLFYVGAIASFLVGMFARVELGARSLGYSLAGAVALILFNISLWRFLQLIPRPSKHYLIRCLQKYNKKWRAPSSLDEEASTRGEPRAEPERKRLSNLLLEIGYFLIPLFRFMETLKVFTCIWWLSVVLFKLTLFTIKLFIGDLPGKVVEEYIVLVVTNLWPDLEWKGYKQSLPEALKRFAAVKNDKRAWWMFQDIATRQWER